MDLRIEKTRNSIVNTFLELRSKKDLEKITVKELCEKAQINKSTFYSHYHDIYDLSEHLEDEVVRERDRKKNRICEAHNLQIIRVENSYARRYNYIKEILLDYFSRKH